jgi:ATP-dependent Clp protease ATP-binding subunit ClpC
MKLSLAVEVLWRMAIKEAIASQHEKIEPEHLFEATMRGKDFKGNQALEELQKRGVDVEGLASELGVCPDVIEKSGLSPVKLRRAVRNKLGEGTFERDSQEAGVIHRSERTKKVFDHAEKIAESRKESALTALSLFGALIEDDSSLICTVLREAGVDVAKMRASLISGADDKPKAKAVKAGDSSGVASESMLEKFGRDLTAEAHAGKLPPVIGRRKEILQVLQTLGKKTKCNPMLVGEPGVGKTAIVEALAQRIVQGKDGHILKGKRLFELNVAALVAGTKYRGEFEERMKKLLEEVKATPDLILFIDEIHTLIGAGDRKGGLDAANLLKPALARGDFTCIGATTIAEYRTYIEKDAALERRFEKIMVPEPSRDETIQILSGLRARFENHHGVTIEDAAIEAAVDLSIRFDADHRLPDKAIDLIDRACVQLCIPALSIRSSMDKESKASVGIQNVAEALAEKTGIPTELINNECKPNGCSKLAGLHEALAQHVIGQEEAIRKVCDRLIISYAALTERKGPLGSFLFTGPSGVGKTELARALARALFGSEQAMIRFDMSEYMEQHAVSRLIGSPPGYIGHEEEGQLTGRLRTNPYSIVLFDEIEKAHPRVSDLLLQVFDDGRLTDSKGRTVDAKNVIFIMTSNLGAQPAIKPKVMGFNAIAGENKDATPQMEHEDLKKYFRPEMINRMDEIIRFLPLESSVVEKIAGLRMEKLAESIRQKYGVGLVYDKEVLAVLCRQGMSAEFGARELTRTIQRLVEIPAIKLLQESLEDDKDLLCIIEGDQISIRKSL